MGRRCVDVYSNICVVARSHSCMRVVLRGCGKLQSLTSCEVQFSTSSQRGNKMLSYRRDTVLQGALVLAKSGRLELGDNILRTLYVYLQPL